MQSGRRGVPWEFVPPSPDERHRGGSGCKMFKFMGVDSAVTTCRLDYLLRPCPLLSTNAAGIRAISHVNNDSEKKKCLKVSSGQKVELAQALLKTVLHNLSPFIGMKLLIDIFFVTRLNLHLVVCVFLTMSLGRLQIS